MATMVFLTAIPVRRWSVLVIDQLVLLLVSSSIALFRDQGG